MGKSHGKPSRTLENHDSVIKLPDYGCIAREIPGLTRREGRKKRKEEKKIPVRRSKKRATKKEANFRIFFPLKVQRILHNPLRSPTTGKPGTHYCRGDPPGTAWVQTSLYRVYGYTWRLQT
jgi:hypothetical protein